MTRFTFKNCIVLWVLAGIGFLLPLSRRVENPNIWWDIAAGRLILLSRSVPGDYPFSFTPSGGGWIAHEWLSDVVIYNVYRVFGFTGLVILKALLVLFLTLHLYLYVQRRTGNWMAGSVSSAFLGLVMMPYWGLRPQLFSYLLLMSLIRLIERWRRGGSIWAVAPLFVLWVNMHSAWVVGLAVLTVVLAEECVVSLRAGKTGRIGHLALIYAAVIGALFLNPLGSRLILYPFQHLASNKLEGLSPVELHQPATWLYMAGIVALCSTVFYGRGRVKFSEWSFAFGTAAVSIVSSGFVPVFAVMAAPVAAAQIKRLGPESRKNRRIRKEFWPLNAAMVAAFVLLFTTFAPQLGTGYEKLVTRMCPVSAADQLWAGGVVGRGRLLSWNGWGGYLAYRLHPAYKISVVKPVDLEKLDPDLILWPRKLPLSVALSAMPEWKLVYSDRMSVLYARKPP